MFRLTTSRRPASRLSVAMLAGAALASPAAAQVSGVIGDAETQSQGELGAAGPRPNPGPDAHALDFTGDGAIDRADIAAFLVAFIQNQDSADLNADAAWDYADVTLFLERFSELTDHTPVQGVMPTTEVQLLLGELRRLARPGDINADGAVTLRDVASFLGAFQNGSAQADANSDGSLDYTDLIVFLRGLAQVYVPYMPAASTPVDRLVLPPRFADIDRNGRIDQNDIAALFIHLAMESARADLNGDESWDYTDVLLFLETYDRAMR